MIVQILYLHDFSLIADLEVEKGRDRRRRTKEGVAAKPHRSRSSLTEMGESPIVYESLESIPADLLSLIHQEI